jgi:PKD domain
LGFLRRWSLLVGLAIAALAVGSGPAVNASAAAPQPSVHRANFVPLLNSPAMRARTAAPIPADLVFNNMDYNGGAVMPSNTDYMVLWSPAGRAAYPAGFISGVSQWFEDLAHDSGGHQNTDSVSAQYQDLTGAFSRYATTFGGVLVDRQPYPASECPVNSPVTNCLTDAQLQTEVERFTTARGLRRDLSHEYFVMTPPHVESCFSNDPTQAFGGCSAGEVPSNLAVFCAYHSNTSISPFAIYANDPFVVGNPGCDDGNHPNGSFDGELSGGLSHEQNESVTDPIANDAWTDGAGPNQGLEVGDQCDGQFGPTLGMHNGAKFNQVINGHFYWYQEEWSNVGHTCLQRLAPLAARPTATLHVTAGAGLTLNFDATGSTAPGGVAEYVWQFNDAFGAQTIEQTTPTISHTFPSAGAFSIGLTVFAHDGSSAGTGGIATTGSSGLSRGFTFSPSRPDQGQTVTFHALFTTMSAQPVLVNLWEFGDGSVGSGTNPTHRYARPGTFKVELLQFSGVGSAFPGAGAAPIVTQTITVTR